MFQTAKCQDINDRTYTMNLTAAKAEKNFNSINETESTPVVKKEDVVVNMAMIESFRKFYDKIQPFSLTDFFRGEPAEISVKYMAYMKVRLNNSSETSANFEKALNIEIEKINSDMIENKTFNASVAYSEPKAAEQHALSAKNEKPSDLKEKTVNTGKDKSKNVKWTHIKS